MSNATKPAQELNPKDVCLNRNGEPFCGLRFGHGRGQRILGSVFVDQVTCAECLKAACSGDDLLACPNCGDGISEDYDVDACAHCAWPLVWTAGVPKMGIKCSECGDTGHVKGTACDWCEAGNTWACSVTEAHAEWMIDDAESTRIYHGWRHA